MTFFFEQHSRNANNVCCYFSIQNISAIKYKLVRFCVFNVFLDKRHLKVLLYIWMNGCHPLDEEFDKEEGHNDTSKEHLSSSNWWWARNQLFESFIHTMEWIISHRRWLYDCLWDGIAIDFQNNPIDFPWSIVNNNGITYFRSNKRNTNTYW